MFHEIAMRFHNEERSILKTGSPGLSNGPKRDVSSFVPNGNEGPGGWGNDGQLDHLEAAETRIRLNRSQR